MKRDNFNIINLIRTTSNISLSIQLHLRRSSLDLRGTVFFQCYRFSSMQLGQKIGYVHDINIEVNTPKKFLWQLYIMHKKYMNNGCTHIFKGWCNNNNV